MSRFGCSEETTQLIVSDVLRTRVDGQAFEMICTKCDLINTVSDDEATEAILTGVMICSKCKGPSTSTVINGLTSKPGDKSPPIIGDHKPKAE